MDESEISEIYDTEDTETFNKKLEQILEESSSDTDIENSQTKIKEVTNLTNLPQSDDLPDSAPVADLNEDIRFIRGVDHVFFINGNGQSMHFVLLLDDVVEKEDITKKIWKHLGTVTTNIQKVGPHSAVLVADDVNQWSYSRDLFKVSYIKDCIEEGKIRDISKYLKCKSREFTPDLDYMKIVYHRTHTWNTVPQEFKLMHETAEQPTRAEADQSNISDVNVDSCISSSVVSSVVSPVDSDQRHPLNVECSKSNVPSRADSKNDVTSQTQDDSFPSQEFDSSEETIPAPTQTDRVSSSVNKRTRAGYSKKEKTSMIRYIVDNKRYPHVKGVALWREMESENVCPLRTWQSMKEHFRKVVIKELDYFYFLSSTQRQKLKFAFK